MTRATQDEDFTRLLREYIDRLRERVGKRMGDLPEHAVERVLNSLVTAAAAILLLVAGGKRREGLVGFLLDWAARYLATHAAKHADFGEESR